MLNNINRSLNILRINKIDVGYYLLSKNFRFTFQKPFSV